MKFFSTNFKTQIANGTICTCIRVQDVLGTYYGFTDHDVQLTVDSLVYKPSAALERISMNLRNNAEVSNQELASAWSIDLPQEDLQAGLFDNAEIYVFKTSWVDVTLGKIDVFKGKLGAVQWSEDGFRADIVSSMQQLIKPIGATTTLKCRHLLFSTASDQQIGFCGVSAGSFTYSSTISSIILQKMKFTCTTLGLANGFCSQGKLVWTGGNNAGFDSTVKIHTAGGSDTIELFLPTNLAMQVGDTFTIYAGCNKTTDHCKNKFNNIANFGGFPHIRSEVNFK